MHALCGRQWNQPVCVLCAPFIESFINVGEGSISKVSYLYVSVSWMK